MHGAVSSWRRLGGLLTVLALLLLLVPVPLARAQDAASSAAASAASAGGAAEEGASAGGDTGEAGTAAGATDAAEDAAVNEALATPAIDQLTNQAESAGPPKAEPPAAIAIDKHINQAQTLVDKLQWQVDHEKQWARNVYEVISNYQYKYNKVLSDIKERDEKAKKLKELLAQLKKARLHVSVQADLEQAQSSLGLLGGEDSKEYTDLKDKVTGLKDELDKLNTDSVDSVLDGVEDKMSDVVSGPLPPKSSDALDETLKGGEDGGGSGAAEPTTAPAFLQLQRLREIRPPLEPRMQTSSLQHFQPPPEHSAETYSQASKMLDDMKALLLNVRNGLAQVVSKENSLSGHEGGPTPMRFRENRPSEVQTPSTASFENPQAEAQARHLAPPTGPLRLGPPTPAVSDVDPQRLANLAQLLKEVSKAQDN